MSSEPASHRQDWVANLNAMRTKALFLKSQWDHPRALERKQAWIDTVLLSEPTHAVTLIWNPEYGRLSPERAQADTAIAHCRVDRALMGRKFNKLPKDERTGYVGFVEHPETNTHAHLAWRVPAQHHGDFKDALKGWWNRLHPYGDLDVQALYDPAGWAAYMVKDQWRSPRAEDAALFLKSRT